MFSSQLPPPKYSKGDDSLKNEKELIKAKILLQKKNGSDDNRETISDELDSIHRQIASNVKFEDFIPLRQRNFNIEIPLPSLESIQETQSRTLHFLSKLQNRTETPRDTVTKIGNREIRMSTPVQDPLQLSRFKRTGKIYTPNLDQNETPTTILHDSSSGKSSKISAEEREKWKIPTLVSQWKNPNGYTVARVIGNGEGSEIKEINSGFSDLSEALEKADHDAKIRLQEKHELKRLAYEREVEAKETKLKQLAENRRKRIEERGVSRKEPLRVEKAESKASTNTSTKGNSGNKILINKLRDIAKREGRDISEKVILGAAEATRTPAVNYDSRLYMKGAASSARRHEEQLYDNPLFVQQSIDSSIYRTDYNKLDDQIESENGSTDVMSKVRKETGTVNRGPIEFTKAVKKEDKD
ncbi:mRNA splicing protein [Maudiozyma exigua]|uniref:Pre-mRNA-processing protein 45 n=1 Tax=Maudiozyma exigua TaxID=34358 RepID=A0A9P6W9C3_MAUEX|nr:mRNA splicing protein [Kazachstania exigua]